MSIYLILFPLTSRSYKDLRFSKYSIFDNSLFDNFNIIKFFRFEYCNPYKSLNRFLLKSKISKF